MMSSVQQATRGGLTEEGLVHIPGLASRWVQLPNGAKAHYMTSGDTGPAVVLCHGGLPGSSGTAGWRFMAPFLGANGFRVYCPDFPGFGLSDSREEHWPKRGSLDHLEFLHMFANAMCLEKFHLSGNSMGCANTVNYVITHPERVISYVLIAGGVGDLVGQGGRVAGEIDVRKLRESFAGTPESMRSMIEPIIYRKEAISRDMLEMRTQAANRHKESFSFFYPANETRDRDPNLSQVLTTKGRLDVMTIPALYLYGLDDVLSPVENGYNQEPTVPNIQFFYPTECGHQGQTDRPDIFNQVFLEFFTDGKVSWETAEWAGVSRRRHVNPQLVKEPPGGFPAPDLSYYNQFKKYVRVG